MLTQRDRRRSNRRLCVPLWLTVAHQSGRNPLTQFHKGRGLVLERIDNLVPGHCSSIRFKRVEPPSPEIFLSTLLPRQFAETQTALPWKQRRWQIFQVVCCPECVAAGVQLVLDRLGARSAEEGEAAFAIWSALGNLP